MSESADFLFELGTEELPPKALGRLSAALTEELLAGFTEAGLPFGGHHAYAAPRRMAVLVTDLGQSTPAQDVERRGPAVASAFDADGNPTKALLGFAKSCGVEVGDLARLDTDKGSWLVYRHTQPGRPAAEIIPAAIERALAKLPTPKRMRWGSGTAEFIRPVHWVVALHGPAVVDIEIMGLKTGRETYGHRFHHPAALVIDQPAHYAAILENKGHVLADFDERRARIQRQIETTAADLGGRARIDPDLLDEVTALVEWPVAVAGRFEESFLEVPHEALISTMQDNQKYFPLVDDQNRLLPWFITIANIDSRDPAAVRAGNERVIRPRFSDALFFWNEDRKHRLESHLDALKTVVFQQRMGTLFDKTLRVEQLAAHIAERIGADKALARRAARLCKCDLQSQMVGEFPELQGIMGRYLAAHDGEPAPVAQALDDYYLPRRAGDALPAGDVAQAVALADRLDTLVGIFAIGQAPTGAKDPFALRRAALGVLRILVEQNLDLDLKALLEEAAKGLVPAIPEAPEHVLSVFEFITERQHRYSLDRGIRADVFAAVAAVGCTRPLDFEQRMIAVNHFLTLPEAEALAAANKRIQNILKKQDQMPDGAIDAALLVEPAERTLFDMLTEITPQIGAIMAKSDYDGALTALAALRDPVDAFFDGVMVMADDPALQRNRLVLLQRIGALFLGIADLAQLNG
ncbi:glycine--tRNA ligase subunit beta [Halothiobacillus diazotrophicus]|uniref:Glycine--tRNA ligase beta subunit n=1 Tax=Halothiobacillus diazotrophicus TaxID=1860122 RepID=A0A191ZIU5_9GAMM|nr:glycine--tRNA ligase subunit beta [Halothiobacillus diazotrophicus]ANJ67804.1 glycine--tRNA ligase subunit beta [Halothiobacillus diazotrophicus]